MNCLSNPAVHPMVQGKHIRELAEGIRTFEDFITDGKIEWIDVHTHRDPLRLARLCRFR